MEPMPPVIAPPALGLQVAWKGIREFTIYGYTIGLFRDNGKHGNYYLGYSEMERERERERDLGFAILASLGLGVCGVRD